MRSEIEDAANMPSVTEQVEAGIAEILADVSRSFTTFDADPTLDWLEDQLREHHADHYALEQSPAGKDWPELSPVTIAAKGHNKILVETDAMRSSLVSTTMDSITRRVKDQTGSEMVFGTSDFKALWHQEGTSRMPQREHVGMSEIFVDRTVNDITDFVVDALREKKQ